jgi:hypothetical protein
VPSGPAARVTLPAARGEVGSGGPARRCGVARVRGPRWAGGREPRPASQQRFARGSPSCPAATPSPMSRTRSHPPTGPSPRFQPPVNVSDIVRWSRRRDPKACPGEGFELGKKKKNMLACPCRPPRAAPPTSFTFGKLRHQRIQSVPPTCPGPAARAVLFCHSNTLCQSWAGMVPCRRTSTAAIIPSYCAV